MPQFQAFRRRWFFASDDLPFAALCGAFFHTVWAVVLTLAALVDRPEGCDGHQGVGIFLYGLIASFVVSVIMDGLIAIVGLRGKRGMCYSGDLVGSGEGGEDLMCGSNVLIGLGKVGLCVIGASLCGSVCGVWRNVC